MARVRYTEGPGKVNLARAGVIAVRGEWCEVPDQYAEELANVAHWEIEGVDKPAATKAKAKAKK